MPSPHHPHPRGVAPRPGRGDREGCSLPAARPVASTGDGRASQLSAQVDTSRVSAQTDVVNEATQLAAAAAHDDPEIGLAAVAALRQLLGQLEALQVAAARAHGWSWERIATALGITRQSVHKKYASRRLPGRRAQ